MPCKILTQRRSDVQNPAWGGFTVVNLLDLRVDRLKPQDFLVHRVIKPQTWAVAVEK